MMQGQKAVKYMKRMQSTGKECIILKKEEI
jgi:hypothetical protein